MSEFGLQDDDKKIILDILKAYPQIEEAVLFGSRALNTFKATSDIDLAIKGKDIHTILAALIADFEESDLIYEVDLVDYAGITSEKLLEHIDRFGVGFYRKGWVETTIGEIVTVGRGSSPRPIHDYLSSAGIPWVKIADATASPTRFIKNTKECIKEEGRSTSVIPGDLIVSNSATPGIPKVMDIEACVHDGWLVFKDYKNIDKWYLFYFFLDFRKRLSHSASGTVFKNLKIDIVRAVPISLPPLPEQKAIANILSSFDEKIELLREQNKTLETLAQTIFKEWFVNFNYPGATDQRVDSELGEIPDGWRVGKLGDVTSIKGGGTPSTKNEAFWNGDIHWTSPKDLSNSKSVFLLDTEKKLTQEGLKKVSSGLLPKGTLLLSSRAPIGYIAISNVDIAINQGYIALLDVTDFSNYYMLFWLKTHIRAITNAANGSTFLEISKSAFRNIDCIIPSKGELKGFDEVVAPTLSKVLENIKQIQALSKTRDALLPKLMSGQVKVNSRGSCVSTY